MRITFAQNVSLGCAKFCSRKTKETPEFWVISAAISISDWAHAFLRQRSSNPVLCVSCLICRLYLKHDKMTFWVTLRWNTCTFHAAVWNAKEPSRGYVTLFLISISSKPKCLAINCISKKNRVFMNPLWTKKKPKFNDISVLFTYPNACSRMQEMHEEAQISKFSRGMPPTPLQALAFGPWKVPLCGALSILRLQLVLLPLKF